MEEIQQHGAYPTSTKFNGIDWFKATDQMPIPHNQYNPYVEAFWKWWPNVYPTLKHFRITGGEPLLTKDTFKALDYMIENPNPEIDFSINSNMCVPDSLLSKFIEKIKIITEEKKVAKFKIFTSADTHGSQAEYIRNGLDYAQWITNIRRVLTEVPQATFTIMSTYNALSVPSYAKFLQDVLRLKTQYYKPKYKQTAVLLDIPYLRWPPHQSIFILTEDFTTTIKEHVDFVQSYAEGTATETYQGFDRLEVERMKRIYEIFQSHNEADTVKNQKDFVVFVDEHDRRRGTNFSATFPEMVTFYNYCHQL
jgi:sulfatase maturation enzyme AslB (radical SAM superfamily)